MRKQFSSLLMLGAVASGLFLTSCNKNKGAETPDVQQNVIVSLDLGRATGLRTAISDAKTRVEDDAAASIKAVDVYLTTADQKITVAQRFENPSPEYSQLVNVTQVAQPQNTGGFKFLKVAKETVKATVIVNPQGDILATDTKLTKLPTAVKVGDDEVLYAQTQDLITQGSEPYGVNPQTDNNDVVKVAEFNLRGAMNRFQVATKFSRIIYKDGTGQAIKDWKEAWLATNPGGDADAEFKKYIGAGFNDGNPTSQWDEFFLIDDITALNEGVFMNNFNNKYDPIKDEVSEYLFAKTFVGTYDVATGKWEPKGEGVEPNVTETASYFKTKGFTTSLTAPADDNKVIAFNYFTKGVENYGANGDAPRLHFYFKGLDAEHQFVNIVGYDDNTGTTLNKDNVNGNHLLNIDLQDIGLNGGKGIIVTSVDPDVPGTGKPDITNEAFNVIVRVQVDKWVATKVKPIVE